MDRAQFYNRYIPTDQDFYQKFGQLTTPFEQLNFADLYTERSLNFLPFINDDKDDFKAEEALREGNDLLDSGKLLEALSFYTKAVALAGSQNSLGLAYARRSRVLAKLQLRNECLVDCNRALTMDLSQDLDRELEERKHEVTRFPDVLSHHLPIPKLTSDEENSEPLQLSQLKPNPQQQGIATTGGIITGRVINVGEVIAIDEPVEVCLKRNVENHCHGCLKLCYNLVPCGSCTQALYCGETCRDLVYKSYHRFECPILATLNHLLIPETHMICLRLIMSNRTRVLSHMKLTGFRDVSKEKAFSLSLSASFVSMLLKRHTNFRFADQIYRRDLMYMLVGMALRFCQVTELAPNDNGSMSVSKIGYGLYLNAMNFGHSCYPNIHQYYYGKTLVMRATRTIKSGTMCYVCYGAEYYERPTYIRQKILSINSHITCNCRACRLDWKQLSLEKIHYPTMQQLKMALPQIAQNPNREKRVREFGEAVMTDDDNFEEPSELFICIWRLVRFNYGMLANLRFM